MLITDPVLLGADPAEISHRLLSAGLTGVESYRTPDGMVISAAEGDAAIESALAGWTPTTSGFDPSNPLSATFEVPVPDYLATHIQHLRDYRQAVRNGQAVTNAQTTHVIADIIDALRFINRRITED